MTKSAPVRIGIDARKIADFGIGTYIRGLLHALAATGEETFIAFGPASIAAQLPAGVEHVVVDAPHYSLRELSVIGRAADGAALDLFHAPHYVVPATKVPVVVTIHDLIHLHRRERNPIKRLYARGMLRRAVRKSVRVITVSEAVARQLERELGARDVAVTPNGIDARFFGDGAAAEGRFVVYAGNDKPHKNVATLVDAFDELRATHGDVQLVLAGGDFGRFADRDGVIAAGFVGDDELAALFRGALAVVQPSIEEGFGLPAAEAMACGAAVITSRAEALVEVTGDAALHVDARDTHALAAALKQVIDDAALRAALGARGRERATALTWTRCAELTRRVYRDALG